MANFVQGKNVAISGGTTGIGRATAILLADNGASVFIFGRHQKELDDALLDIEKTTGQKAFGAICDVSNENEIKNLFKIIDVHFDKLDIFVNNAGLAARSVLNTDFKEIDYVVETNLIGYLYCTKLATERMIKSKSGHIINIGSLSSTTRDADTDLYVATKSGVDGFNDSIRKLISRSGIKVTIIDPGSVGTNLVNQTIEEQKKAEEKEMMLKAEDVAEAILFCLLCPKRVDILKIQLRGHRQIV